jgi:carboxyl-terminal processing protease
MNKKNLILMVIMSFMAITNLNAQINVQDMNPDKTLKKVTTLMYLIDNYYVDTLNMNEISESMIVNTLKELDPHSAYISKKDVEKANEGLEGSFEGVGLTFQLYKDTILVIAPIPGGPSDKVGILAGDKIVTVNGENAFGKDINNEWVMDHLRGEKGTVVIVGIHRKGLDKPIDYKIIRDEIPINSMDASFMLNAETGYIKLNRFARQSQEEFDEAISRLKKQGMKNLVFDLRGNTGGYLGTAMSIADEFLPAGKSIVYTEGVHSPRQDLNATSAGKFEQGKLVVLINEGSASASEIVSGAIQDWDRGVLIGRRSFGKGLVQRPFQLPDGSQVRLTVARYYTPSGRNIQKPYDDGTDEYYKDFLHRIENGELESADSIHFPDSLKFQTANGRLVYGGGGIMSDIFVPFDSVRYSKTYSDFIRKGIINGFVNDYLDQNRTQLLKKYPEFKQYNKNFVLSEDEFQTFLDKAAKEKIEVSAEELTNNKTFVMLQLKGLIARNLYEVGDYFEVIAPSDKEISKALEVIQQDQTYKKLLD